jgi:murein DD-endopeptidase MepM/ murein hydrolase activator NlpD
MATTLFDTTVAERAGAISASRRLATRRRRVALSLAGVAAAIALSAATMGASEASPADINIGEAERQSQQLRQRQAEVAAKIDEAKATEEQLVAALTVLDQQVQAEIAKGTEAERAYKDADRRYDEVQGQLAENQREIDAINNGLRQQAIRRYVRPENNDSSMRLLQANDIDEAEQRKVLADAVAGNSGEAIERLRGARARIEDLREQASAARAEADSKRAEQQELFNAVVSEMQAQQRLQSEWNRRVGELKVSEDAIDAQADNLERAIADQRSTGTGPMPAPAPGASSGRMVSPVPGRIGSGYGGARNHPGVDILAPVGTPVLAALSGRVTRVDSGGGYNGGYGNLVVISHANGLETRYAHLSRTSVSVGQTVSQGQQVGAVGMTGNTSGPHLHFETYSNGARQNPSNYLP